MFEGYEPDKIRMLLSVFVGEICEKTAFCLRSIDDVSQELQRPDFDSSSLFFSLQNALLHSSSISLSFWPTDKKALQRGVLLREGFKCSSSICFFKDRKFRNHISHIDERLDNWWNTSQNHIIARHIIGKSGSIGGVDPREVFENFDPDKREFIFRGDTFSLSEFQHHCMEIYSEAQELSELTWWDENFVAAFPLTEKGDT